MTDEEITPVERLLSGIYDEKPVRGPSLDSGVLTEEEIEELLAPLDDQEREVLRLRFGVDRGAPRSLEEIGHQLGLPRENVREIEARAFDKIRHPENFTEAAEE